MPRSLSALVALGLSVLAPVAAAEEPAGDDLSRYVSYTDESDGVDWAVGVLMGRSPAKGWGGVIVGGGSRGHALEFEESKVHIRDYRVNVGLGFSRDGDGRDRFALGLAGAGQSFWGVSSPGPVRIYGASGGGNGEGQLMLNGFRHNRIGLGWGAEVGAAVVTEPVVVTAALIGDLTGMLIIDEPNYLEGNVGARMRVGLGQRLYFRTSLERSVFRVTSLENSQALVGTAFLDVPLGTVAGKARVMIGADALSRRVQDRDEGGSLIASYSPGLFADPGAEVAVGIHLILEELVRPEAEPLTLRSGAP